MKGKVGKLKRKKDKNFNKQISMAKNIPTFILQAVLNLNSFISYSLGLAIPALKVRKHHFGSAILTNISGMGVTDAYAPHIDFANTNMLMVICAPSERVVIVDGKPGIKKMMNLTITYDARISDGANLFKALDCVKDVWKNPQNYL